VDGVSAGLRLSSESGTAEGRITRRLLDEMAGYLYLLPAAGWAKETTIWDAASSQHQNQVRV
jgi:hypothetical protein